MGLKPSATKGHTPDEGPPARAWLFSVLAILPFLASALAWRTQTFSAAGRVPLGYDAFFHARRAIQWAEGRAEAFDPSIHAPEGSWVAWPWAWDALLGGLVRVSRFAGLHPLELPLAAPVVVGVLNLVLLHCLLVAFRANRWAALAAIVAVGVSPSFVMTHAFGGIDHHALELTVAASVLLLMSRPPGQGSRAGGLALGLVLGFSHAIHPGLFVWHVPLVGAAAWQWLRGESAPRAVANATAAGLVAGVALAALPQGAVWEGLFQFDIFSWFHVYVTLLTAAGLLVVAHLPPRPIIVAAVFLIASAATLLLVRELGGGLRWLSGDLEFFEHLTETADILEYGMRYGWRSLAQFYGPILAVGAVAMAWYFAVGRRLTGFGAGPTMALALVALLGLSQVRYAYLLVPVLWLSTAVFATRMWERYPRPAVRLALGISFVACLLVPLPQQLRKPSVGGDNLFASSQGFWPHLAGFCSEGRPIVLAEPVFGHFINYFSECRTIANNFVNNPLHEAKIRTVYALLEGPASALAERAPFVDLVLVRSNPVGDDGIEPCARAGLGADLICRHSVPGFRLLAEIRVAREHGRSERLLGLFRVEPPVDGDPTAPGHAAASASSAVVAHARPGRAYRDAFSQPEAIAR